VLLKHDAPIPLSFALLKAGSKSPARMAIMAMTTSNSINVNPLLRGRRDAVVLTGRLMYKRSI
jgi:hypothetical protein